MRGLPLSRPHPNHQDGTGRWISTGGYVQEYLDVWIEE